ncbi:MAG TPA: ATP synthase F1 subunit gamma, partial [Gemmatimonadales bacterium]|nr:ATP synthase F1 subunit gamma [Gemmatimonadales bacterium]
MQNTRKITRTMELVATSKLKRAQDRVVAARPYAEALRQVLGDLVTRELAEQFPLLRAPAPPEQGGPRKAALLLITSNRGLAGAFNSNLIKEARRQIEQLEAAGLSVDLYAVGKKGAGYFKYLKRPLAADRQDIGDKPTAEHAASLVDPLMLSYERGELASVDLVHAKFVTPLSTPPVTTRVLPVPAPAGRTRAPYYIFAPDPGAILEQLLPLYVRNMVYRGLVETAAGEQGARRTAMKN